jgi:actin-related protein
MLGCDLDARKDIMANVVITGGNTLIGGFAEHFEKCLAEVSV